ncbi:hypothetical protein DL96DRAFT_1622976 [Flagelloscypha sp. PMI_526]|nr:hypothetical protein DL96DRAFT_1622976 [Flagelloscypha sp. PMI_526]
MLTMTNSELPTSTRLPPEILQHMVSFIDDHLTLAAVCLMSRAFVFPARAKLFDQLDLSQTSHDTIQSLKSSPHILQHVRSITLNRGYLYPELDTLLATLGERARLRELIAFYIYRWKTTLLRELQEKFLPFLASLTLDKIDAPLFLVTSCTSLEWLRVYQTTLYVEEEEGFSDLFDLEEYSLRRVGITSSLLEAQSIPFLKGLALDRTRNDNQSMCPLVKLIEKFPALKCLDLGRNDTEWFPLEDITKVVKPLMSQLVCLDIGYWPQWAKDQCMENRSQDLDLLQIHHYPRLLFFSIRLIRRLEQIRNQDLEYLYDQLLPRPNWLFESIKKVTYPHPLRILRIQPAADWSEDIHDGDIGTFEDLGALTMEPYWILLDRTLVESPLLEGVEKVVIPIHPKYWATRAILKRDLPVLNAAEKLSFETKDIKEYFLSLTSP